MSLLFGSSHMVLHIRSSKSRRTLSKSWWTLFKDWSVSKEIWLTGAVYSHSSKLPFILFPVSKEKSGLLVQSSKSSFTPMNMRLEVYFLLQKDVYIARNSSPHLPFPSLHRQFHVGCNKYSARRVSHITCGKNQKSFLNQSQALFDHNLRRSSTPRCQRH